MPRQKFFRRKSFDLFKRVIDLRKKECSYAEIRKETGLAKSTIQSWLTHAGLTLTKEHFEIYAKNRALAHEIATVASKITRARRKAKDTQSFIQRFNKYFSDPFFVAGVMLYEAEGSKGQNNGFSNSDFRLISTYIKFIERYFLLDRNKNMKFTIYIHDTRANDLEKIRHFWAKAISIKPTAFKICWKHNIVTERRVNPDYVGQLNVRVKGVRNFTGKMLAISDIILRKYQRI